MIYQQLTMANIIMSTLNIGPEIGWQKKWHLERGTERKG